MPIEDNKLSNSDIDKKSDLDMKKRMNTKKQILISNRLDTKNLAMLENRAATVLLNKRGTAMVESAIFFPIIILAAMFTVYMMINMYSEAVLQAKINREVRAASMTKVENASVQIGKSAFNDRYRVEAEENKVLISEGDGNGFDYIYGTSSLDWEGGKLTKYMKKKTSYEGKSYCIDEKDYIWR